MSVSIIERAIGQEDAETGEMLLDLLRSEHEHEYVASILTRGGYRCSETSVRRYRKKLKESNGQSG